MSDKKPPLKKGITPKGIAIWPSLNKPDEFKGKRAYKTALKLTAEDAADLIAKIEEATAEKLAETKAALEKRLAEAKTGDAKVKVKKALAGLTTCLPYIAAVDDEGNETGDFIFKFKANAEYKDKRGNIKSIVIPLFDAKGKPTKVNVWGGSTIRVGFAMVPYYVESANQCGISLRLEGVKVINPVNGSGARDASSFGFDEEEDGYSADEDETLGTPEDGADEDSAVDF